MKCLKPKQYILIAFTVLSALATGYLLFFTGMFWHKVISLSVFCGSCAYTMFSYLKCVNSEKQLHDTTMNLAISLSEYFMVIDALAKGNYGLKANETTGDALLDQLGKTTNSMIESEKALIAAAKKIATGDLTSEIHMRSENDELSMVFQEMETSLIWLLISLRDTVNSLVMATESMSTGTEESTSSMEMISETMNHMSESTVHITNSIQDVAKNSHTANELALRGADSMGKLSDKIMTIREAVELNLTVMQELESKAAQISHIVKTIQEIASQTNLLSLNATIEAARAGDAGRGFSVVAHEIGKLSEDSAKSAKEINKILKELKSSADKAGKMTKVSFGEVTSGVGIMEESAGLFSEIAGSVEHINTQVESVAAATEQNSASSEEIAAAIEEQTQIVMEIAKTAQMMAETTGTLNTQVEQFKTA